MKPDGCRCDGDVHINMMCFVTPRPEPSVRQMLKSLGYVEDADEALRLALSELLQSREAIHERFYEDQSPTTWRRVSR